jgi:hypothetical protein
MKNKQPYKAVFINTVNKTVEDVVITGGLHEMYKLIGCDLVDIRPIDKENSIVVDDEGLLTVDDVDLEGKPQCDGFFFLLGPPASPGPANIFAGRALIIGATDDKQDATVNAAMIREFIRFVPDDKLEVAVQAAKDLCNCTAVCASLEEYNAVLKGVSGIIEAAYEEIFSPS